MSEPLSVRETMIESLKDSWSWMSNERDAKLGTLHYQWAKDLYREAVDHGIQWRTNKSTARAVVSQRPKREWCYWDALIEWGGRITFAQTACEWGSWRGFHRVMYGESYKLDRLFRDGYPNPYFENVRFADQIELNEETGYWHLAETESLCDEFDRIHSSLTAYRGWMLCDTDWSIGHVGEMIGEFDALWKKSHHRYYVVERGNQRALKYVFSEDILPEWRLEQYKIDLQRSSRSEAEKEKSRVNKKLLKIRSKRITIKPKEIMASTEKLLNLCKTSKERTQTSTSSSSYSSRALSYG